MLAFVRAAGSSMALRSHDQCEHLFRVSSTEDSHGISNRKRLPRTPRVVTSAKGKLTALGLPSSVGMDALKLRYKNLHSFARMSP